LDALLLIAGFALPWALGVALLAALPGVAGAREEPGALAWQVGCGWFVGAFALTLWMRALSMLGVPFGIVSIGAPLAVLAAALGAVAWRSSDRLPGNALRKIGRSLAGADLVGWRRAVWLVLLAWIALRFCLLLAEVWWRPLYPWDAWTQWATKARTWFELKRLVPFVDAADFFQSQTDVYFDAAPHYPATVPLFQVWAATLIGRWDDARVNLPWWIIGVAFGLAIFGFLRQQRIAALPALLGAWLVLSLPILDVHVALAGYADLPMAAYFTLGAVALLRALETRSVRDAALALLLIGACTMVKNPGIIWVLTLIPGVILAKLPRNGLRIVALCFAVVAAVVLVLARSAVSILGYRLHFDFDLPVGALFDAYFTFGNWHLLWYGVLAAAAFGGRHLLSRNLAPLTVVTAAGVSFLLFGFAFTNAGQWVEDQSTVNRATLHLAPLLVLWMLLVFRALAAPAASAIAPAVVNSGADA
jgi:hypothetical protein